MRAYKSLVVGSCLWLSACMLGRVSSELDDEDRRSKPVTGIEQSDAGSQGKLDMTPESDIPTTTEEMTQTVDAAPDLPEDMSAVVVDATMDMVVDMPPPGPRGSQGCRTGQGLTDGEHTLVVGERERRYVLRLPENYARDKTWPLVFALHGNGGNTGYWDSMGGDRDIRATLKDEAILVVAAAIDRKWRDYDAPRDTWPARIEEELEYFEAVLGELRSDLCIQEEAIFAMGFSGGGSFSGVLGCRRDDIRAIAVGGSVIYFDAQDCVGTPAAWVTIGEGELNSGREAYRDFFRDRAGCGSGTQDTAPGPCVAYDGCGQGTPVHYCQHGGGHVWPGFGVEATWDFFKQFVQ